MMDLILASQSPRRSELLKQIGLDFEIIPSTAPEIIDYNLPPEEVVVSLSKIKAVDVFSKNQNSVVIGADTIVCFENKILGKPKDVNDAKTMLKMLSGKQHSVFTGVTIIDSNHQESFFEETKVYFFDLTDDEIDAYIKTGEPMDKAGSYGIQGKGCLFVEKIIGDYFSVVGLPVSSVAKKLKNF